MKYTEKADGFSHTVGYEYDLINNLTALVETINSTKYVTGYTYDKDNRVTSIAGGLSAATDNGSIAIGGATIKDYTYDVFGRVSNQVTSKYDGTYVPPQPEEGSTEPTEAGEAATEPTVPAPDPNKTTVKTDTFQFTGSTGGGEGTEGWTSSQVSRHTIKVGANSDDYKEFTYTYDGNGNILTVSDGANTTTYTYDKANQLIQENNQAAGKIWVWTYDNAGNILSKTEYDHTDTANSPDGTTVIYRYDNTNWGDLLTSVGGKTITYDEIGNMLTYNGSTFTWAHGRELLSLTKSGITWTNTYNADGLRTKRTNGSATYNYVYNGSSLSQMTVGSNTLNFAYDASGSPMAVTHNGTTYYYVTNLQGDVVALLDSTGDAVVKYTYNAWGQLLTTIGTKATTLGVHNPLRYRGYVYDTETSLYYLQSRYYDPALGRFINADDTAYLGTDDTPLSYNLFTYCGNNPVMGYDPTGHWDWGGVAAGLTMIAATVAIVATCGVATPVAALVASAIVTTGVVTTCAAATDSAMVFDFSYSYQSSAHSYIKSGASVIIDFGRDEVSAYLHTGGGMGLSSGLSYSVGMVHNYEEPTDYEGPFVDYSGGNNVGVDKCWSPEAGIVDGTGATSITFSLGVSYGVGYDHYGSAIMLCSW